MTTIHAAPAFPPAIPGPLVALWNDGIALGGAPYVAFTKGAVDRLLDMSDAVWVNRRAEPLDAAWRARMVAAEDRLARDGMRVLGIAFRTFHAPPTNGRLSTLEQHLIFIGLVRMRDPARAEERATVQTCATTR